MTDRALLPAHVAGPRGRTLLGVILVGALIIAVWYLQRFVLPYATFDPAIYGYLWTWRFALLAHLGGGVVALLIGPFQIWLGLTRRRLRTHRTLGRIYLGAAATSLAGAVYLIAKELPDEWVFAGGLLGLSCAWTLTTGMAYLAIRRRHIQQHMEWMIRSYVVACAFVFFRVFVDVLHAFGLHSSIAPDQTPEEVKVAAWICWSIPLLVTEAFIQWRHVRSAGHTSP